MHIPLLIAGLVFGVMNNLLYFCVRNQPSSHSISILSSQLHWMHIQARIALPREALYDQKDVSRLAV